MFKTLLCLCLIGMAYAGGAGYNYHSTVAIDPPRYVAPVPQATQPQVQYTAPETQYTKQFYHFSAPEEHHAQASEQVPRVTQTVKKHLNVIFIKPPEDKTYEKAARQLVNNVVEETKTHIYVLSKEPNRAALRQAAATQQVSHHSHKPEVHFVKYSTPAEAQHKQQQIVQQYGGGNVVSLNGGSDSGYHGAASNVNRQYLAPPAPANGYIPPAF